MTAPQHRHRPADEGSVLAIALVFVLVVGLIVATLLTRVDVGLRTTRVVRATTDKTYAADAGIEYAIETLRLHPELCSKEGDEGSLADLEVDGRTVTITCKTVSGSSSGADGWAVITTDADAPGLTTQSGGDETIQGPVFSVRIPADELDLTVDHGSLYDQEPCLPVPPTRLEFDPPQAYGYRCISWPVPDPAHELPPVTSLPNRDGSPEFVLDSGCAIFRPGKYLNAPELLAENYFVSGTYYFENVGEWIVDQANVYGGEMASWEGTINRGFAPARPPFDPCAEDELVTEKDPTFVPDGTGVKFILGGNSWLHVGNLGSMELWSRDDANDPADEGTEGISLQTVTGDAPEGYVESMRWPAPVVQVDRGAKAELSIHGMVYAPNGFVDFFATNGTNAQLVGGVVAKRLHLQSSNPATGLIVSSQAGAPGGRTVDIVATAPGLDGDRPVVSKATVVFPNDPPRTSQVISWRNDVR